MTIFCFPSTVYGVLADMVAMCSSAGTSKRRANDDHRLAGLHAFKPAAAKIVRWKRDGAGASIIKPGRQRTMYDTLHDQSANTYCVTASDNNAVGSERAWSKHLPHQTSSLAENQQAAWLHLTRNAQTKAFFDGKAGANA